MTNSTAAVVFFFRGQKGHLFQYAETKLKRQSFYMVTILTSPDRTQMEILKVRTSQVTA